MAVICYSAPISAVPTNGPFLSEERTVATSQIDSLKFEGLVWVYTDRHLCIYFIGSVAFPSGCYKLRGKLINNSVQDIKTF